MTNRILSIVIVFAIPAASLADDAANEQFEKQVRPLLVTHCQSCHAGAKVKGGLNLESRAGFQAGGDSGPAVVAGKPDESLLIEAVRYKGDMRMPPKGKLSDAEVAILTEWVRRGANWPGDGSEAASIRSQGSGISPADREFWSFRPVRDPALPAVRDAGWVSRPIDRFILAALEQRGLQPSAAADRRTLIRRLSFDLHGLPPTPEEVEAFVADPATDAVERLIDRLLASPRYGERWGRYWLDVARYGEDQAHTFQARLYPQGWRYRDWVVDALNADMPYDRFIREQLAGDLLPGGSAIATGFLALGPHYYRDAGEEKKAEAAELDDRVDTVGRGLLGLTVACARCHDHKFDPIPTEDYYSLAGVFQGSQYQELSLAPADELAAYEKAQATAKAADTAVKQFLDAEAKTLPERLLTETAAYMVAAYEVESRKLGLPQHARQAKLLQPALERWHAYLFTKNAGGQPQFEAWRKAVAAKDAAGVRTAAEGVQAAALEIVRRRDAKEKSGPSKAELDWLAELTHPKAGPFGVEGRRSEAYLDDAGKKRLAELKAEAEARKKAVPSRPAFAHAVRDDKPANMPVYIRGNPYKPGPIVPRRFLQVLSQETPASFQQGSGRRELADAIAHPDNPLTARVIVNRVWAWHFGRGIVSTPSNFGRLGVAPTHPELLDHLATQFVRSGWSLKTLHREILLSSTYRQASAVEAGAEANAEWLPSFPRRRLDAEAFRDALLSVAGRLDDRIGGPSRDLDDPKNLRRTFYAAVSRHKLNGMLRIFDFPDPNLSSESRPVTIVPLQQLFVLNSPFMIEQARALAQRVAAGVGTDEAAFVRAVYRQAFARQAEPDEITGAVAFLTGPVEPGETSGLSRREQLAQVLLASNEFCFVD